MLIYSRKVECAPSPFFACFCLASAASPTFFNGLRGSVLFGLIYLRGNLQRIPTRLVLILSDWRLPA
jgi:hypothetical protein